MIDYAEMESKWQKAWDEAKIFEGEVGSKKPYFVTAAFPYPNAPQHIGHLRTYGTADVLARYRRMLGYNVLYPMGFHATGTPVLAIAKRIKAKDQDLINDLRLFHVPDEEIAKMTEPTFIAEYFIKEIERGMHAAGYSVDWRRKFVSIEPFFSKFVEWQFGILNGKGYLKQGRHPVGWCPNENNAVGMHDTKRDVEPEIGSMTVIKFDVEGLGAKALCATFRPETIFGVTNLFANENSAYVICRLNKGSEQCIISKSSAAALAFQMEIEIVKEIEGKELLGKKCTNPANGLPVPILPGFFVKEEVGTGLVMSVPAHAPFDYVALERLKASGYNIGEIKPIKVIEIEKKSGGKVENIPALTYLESLGWSPGSANDVIELATKEEYKEESHMGRMIIEGYAGMGEQQAREKIKEMLEGKEKAFEIYTLTNETQVLCRCGYPIVVNVVENQWFIDYGDDKWKEEARAALNGMRILPESSRKAMDAALEWINLRAVARAQGLGTRFPFDKEKIIESLSDSTIYMAFYTISNLIRSINSENLKSEFFDYVFLNKGDADSVAKSTGIDYDTVKKCRESFEYWYQDTSNHSASELIFNHLTMYIFNHVAVLDKKNWPKQVVANGIVLSEGEKMSKSLGNIVPLMDGLKAHGADPLRAVVVAGADLLSDSDYTQEAVKGVKERFNYLFEICESLDGYESGELKHIDYWFYSRLNRKIENVSSAYEKLELRDALTQILYDSVIELRRYAARGGKSGIAMREYLSKIALMLQPIAPHVSEELWRRLGNTTFSSVERWPAADKEMISRKIDEEEETLNKTVADAKQIIELMKRKGTRETKSMRIIVAENWKRDLSGFLAKSKNVSKTMEYAKMAEGIDMEKASKYITALAKKMESVRGSEVTQEEEQELYSEAKEYLENALGAKVEIENESESKSERAARAMPLKPSLELY